MSESDAAADRFATLIEALAGTEGVTVGSGKGGFGSDALQVDGRIFAMVTRGCLVLKLPRARVNDLVASGDAGAFDAGKGRPMKEWAAFEVMPSADEAVALGREALAFVAGLPKRGRATGSPRSETATAAQKFFDEIAVPYLSEAGAERRRLFGAEALRLNGTSFAFLSRDLLVVKVAGPSAQALLAKGQAITAESVSPSMRSMIAIPYVATSAGRQRWRRLLAEAHDQLSAPA
jgi:TfoX/Sxy family transcriptional regulator of competence genes